MAFLGQRKKLRLFRRLHVSYQEILTSLMTLVLSSSLVLE